jgi:hypothetical protein
VLGHDGRAAYAEPVDRGDPISYRVLERGTPVETSDGQPFGSVKRVLEVRAKDVFDGVVVKTPSGDRFVDADEIDRLYENLMLLNLSAEAAALLPRPGDSPATFAPSPGATIKRRARRALGRISRK